MIFFWSRDRYAEEIPLGRNVSGLRRNGERPDFVLLSREEDKLLERSPEHADYKYTIHLALSSASRKEIIVIKADTHRFKGGTQ